MTETKLWFEKEQGSKKARDRLIEFYLPLVTAIAKNIVKELSIKCLDIEELVSFGMEGLIYAVDNFDPSRGLKFITYALPRIRGSIFDGLRKLDFLPRSARDKADLLLKKEEELAKKLSRKPTQYELAQDTSYSMKNVFLYSKTRNSIVSLNAVHEIDDDTYTLAELIAEKNPALNPEATLEKKEKIKVILDAIQSLPPKNKIVIALHYLDGFKFKDIGKMLGVTESRVSQLHSSGLSIIRKNLKEKEIHF